MSVTRLTPLRRAVLAMLAGAGDAGLESKDMADLAAGSGVLQRQQTIINGVLCRMLAHRLVTRIRRVPGQGHGGGYRWRITPAGRAALARPTAREARDARKARNQERRQAALGALGTARAAGHGPCTPLAVQLEVRAGLRAAGCSWQQIGDLFGVTREGVRKSLARAGAQ